MDHLVLTRQCLSLAHQTNQLQNVGSTRRHGVRTDYGSEASKKRNVAQLQESADVTDESMTSLSARKVAKSEHTTRLPHAHCNHRRQSTPFSPNRARPPTRPFNGSNPRSAPNARVCTASTSTHPPVPKLPCLTWTGRSSSRTTGTAARAPRR